MYKVQITGQELDKLKIDQERGCIDLYAPYDLKIEPHQVRLIQYDISMLLSDDVLAVPFTKDKQFKLYHPYTFGRLIGFESNIRIPIDGTKLDAERLVNEGDYIATYRFMTTQFFALMKKGMDKGLRPSFIKIEIV